MTELETIKKSTEQLEKIREKIVKEDVDLVEIESSLGEVIETLTSKKEESMYEEINHEEKVYEELEYEEDLEEKDYKELLTDIEYGEVETEADLEEYEQVEKSEITTEVFKNAVIEVGLETYNTEYEEKFKEDGVKEKFVSRTKEDPDEYKEGLITRIKRLLRIG